MPRLVDQRTIEERYTCSICLGIYDRPRTIRTCGHIFCKECLNALEKYTCPLCRGRFTPSDSTDAVHLADEIRSVHIECPECRLVIKVQNLEAHQYQCRYSQRRRPQNSIFLEEAKSQINQIMKHPLIAMFYQTVRFIFTCLIPGFLSFIQTACSMAKNLVQFAYFSSDNMLYIAQLIFALLRRIAVHLLYDEPIPMLLRPISWLIKVVIFFYFQASWLGILFIGMKFCFKMSLRFFQLLKNFID